ncbi:hypothetical protein X781_2300 [Mannheimia sp. USDA-ARS-USMARC-1261]|nr:hypothetical protein X781_2300 [Mannheimia sp. USDA-ARS-USMARC-1261]
MIIAYFHKKIKARLYFVSNCLIFRKIAYKPHTQHFLEKKNLPNFQKSV